VQINWVLKLKEWVDGAGFKQSVFLLIEVTYSLENLEI
jgi:hypothetical protein